MIDEKNQKFPRLVFQHGMGLALYTGSMKNDRSMRKYRRGKKEI